MWVEVQLRTIGFRAFSSEVETGSRQENASIKNLEPRFDSIETEKALVCRNENPDGGKHKREGSRRCEWLRWRNISRCRLWSAASIGTPSAPAAFGRETFPRGPSIRSTSCPRSAS